MTRFILVRHGQTAWNHSDRFRGHADVPLDDTGLAQAAATGRRVAMTWKPVAVYCSPLRRAVQTAEAIAAPLGLSADPHPGLIDIDFGQWQGLSREEATARWPEMAHAWFFEPEKAHPPGGETLADVRARSSRLLADLAARHPDQSVVLVGHTVVNRVILLGILGLGIDRFWRLGQDTCAINVFATTDGDFDLVSMNDVCHLA
jgi:phosphoserine phosphatase